MAIRLSNYCPWVFNETFLMIQWSISRHKAFLSLFWNNCAESWRQSAVLHVGISTEGHFSSTAIWQSHDCKGVVNGVSVIQTRTQLNPRSSHVISTFP